MRTKKEVNSDKNIISSEIESNKAIMNDMFTSVLNSDFKSKEFVLHQTGQKALLFYYSSAVDTTKIQQGIIRPLIEKGDSDVLNTVTLDSIEEVHTFDEAASRISEGKAILYIDGVKGCYSIDVTKFEHRSIEKAENENVVKGPKDAFTESMPFNLSLLRKRIQDKDLIAESIKVGERSKLVVNVMYIKNIANEEIIENVRERLEKIEVDSVQNLELLEQYIEERPYSMVPSLLYTERPDKAAAFLRDGYIILLMDNSSACLILPVTFWSFFHTTEDRYLRLIFGNFSRIIRMVAIFITLFTSAIYIAITNFHSEMIPMDLLLAISSAREKVPFPAVVEVVIMEFAFELIREAGLRIPSPLGPTIGIVGAIIIGQAAVQANVISPIIIIVVSLSGLSSFTVSDVSFNYTVRLSRFIFITAASLYGIYSLTGAFILWVVYLVSLTSFGVSFLSPVSPNTVSSNDTFLRRALIKEEFRPGYLRLRDLRKKKKV
ncbi:spore germination protein [Bacillus sp. SCS-153A]|uniref:spore germination protein n=1 Tax=Rossellomorea sedimentorum TaxID=3115294 RepID=UPI0039069C18